jgi:glycosyltransferase involved in cell wall biosynthesis
MVAVEAAACGAFPVSAAHSGLREVTRTFEPAVEPDVARLLSYPLGRDAVREIAARLVGWLELPAERRAAARAALSGVARERYGWERVAESVIAAAQGRLSELPEPPG